MDYMMLHDELTLRLMVKKLAHDVGRMIGENWKVYCMTHDPVSTLMWSHYAQNHTGICLEFAVVEQNIFGKAGKVQYCGRYPEWQLDDAENSILEIAFLSKSKSWEYEQEFRVLAVVPNRPLPRVVSLPLVREGKIVFPEGSLTSIICGCEMSNDDYAAVERLASKHSVASKKVKRKPNHYELFVQSRK